MSTRRSRSSKIAAAEEAASAALAADPEDAALAVEDAVNAALADEAEGTTTPEPADPEPTEENAPEGTEDNAPEDSKIDQAPAEGEQEEQPGQESGEPVPHPFDRNPDAAQWMCVCGMSRASKIHDGQGSVASARKIAEPVETHKFRRNPTAAAWICTCGASRGSKVHEGSEAAERSSEPHETVLVRKLVPGMVIHFRDLGDVVVASRVSVKGEKLRYLIGHVPPEGGGYAERKLWANSAYRVIGTVPVPEYALPEVTVQATPQAESEPTPEAAPEPTPEDVPEPEPVIAA